MLFLFCLVCYLCLCNEVHCVFIFCRLSSYLAKNWIFVEKVLLKTRIFSIVSNVEIDELDIM